MTKSDEEQPTLMNSTLVGWSYWRLVLNQYLACYFTSPTRILKTSAHALLYASLGLIVTLGIIWLENAFPKLAPEQFHRGFMTLYSIFLLPALASLVCTPATVPLYPIEDRLDRFSLRKLLIAMTAFCILLSLTMAWLRLDRNVKNRRESITNHLNGYGEVYSIGFAPLSSSIRELRIDDADDDEVRSIVALPETDKLILLQLHESSITEKSLDKIASLRYLRKLIIYRSTLPEASIRRFEEQTGCDFVH